MGVDSAIKIIIVQKKATAFSIYFPPYSQGIAFARPFFVGQLAVSGIPSGGKRGCSFFR
jgi:hypothetical protein